MAERAEHRVGERALVPRAVVAAAVDEERRRELHAARARARDVRVARAPRGARVSRAPSVSSEATPRSSADGRRSSSVSVSERVISATCASQNCSGRRRMLDELGRAAREVAAGQRAVAEHVAQAVAELVAHLRDALVGGAAMRAGVAAVLDQRDRGRAGPSTWSPGSTGRSSRSRLPTSVAVTRASRVI